MPIRNITFRDGSGYEYARPVDFFDNPRLSQMLAYSSDQTGGTTVTPEIKAASSVTTRDIFTKYAASRLRASMGLRWIPRPPDLISDPDLVGTWEMFYKPTGEHVGKIKVNALPGEPAQVLWRHIVPKWRGNRLSNKMLGEVMRRHKALASDWTVSTPAMRTWKSMARRSSPTGLFVEDLTTLLDVPSDTHGFYSQKHMRPFFVGRPSQKAMLTGAEALGNPKVTNALVPVSAAAKPRAISRFTNFLRKKPDLALLILINAGIVGTLGTLAIKDLVEKKESDE